MDSGIDPELMRRVAAGEYVVDPHAVADAIVRRSVERREARRFLGMLEARQGHGLSVRPDQPQPGPGRD
ncbi:MAG TPA: hypothetical protein VF545_14120 [Thermoleophilaceae bacterium]|jgi:hypothetical protein